MRHKVGVIDNHDVIFLDTADIIFCKNTALRLKLLEEVLYMDRIYVKKKSLEITNDGYEVRLGCLKTSLENCKQIITNIHKIKTKK